MICKTDQTLKSDWCDFARIVLTLILMKLFSSHCLTSFNSWRPHEASASHHLFTQFNPKRWKTSCWRCPNSSHASEAGNTVMSTVMSLGNQKTIFGQTNTSWPPTLCSAFTPLNVVTTHATDQPGLSCRPPVWPQWFKRAYVCVHVCVCVSMSVASCCCVFVWHPQGPKRSKLWSSSSSMWLLLNKGQKITYQQEVT